MKIVHICIYRHFTTTYIFVNTVKYASSTKSQIKRKFRLWRRHMPSAFKKKKKKHVAWVIPTGLPLSHSKEAEKGDTSICLQSYKIKRFKMAAFVASQYYPPLALCKNIYILWWFALYSVFKLASNPIQDSF